jgi:hypothetical protein
MWTELEQRAVRDMLRKCREHLRYDFDGVVSNGSRCPVCGAHGMGTSEPHKDNCAGVELLRHIGIALGEVGP